MTSSPRLLVRLRLEDVVALVFFFLNLLLRIIFRGLKSGNFSPADVLIIIPAVTLLLAKEMVHYFVAGSQPQAGKDESPWAFARPFWEILRDWFPFLVILLMYYTLWGDATLLMVTTDRDQALIATSDLRLFALPGQRGPSALHFSRLDHVDVAVLFLSPDQYPPRRPVHLSVARSAEFSRNDVWHHGGLVLSG